MRIDHIAILVNNLEESLSSLPQGIEKNKIQTFPAEGTREVYIKSKDSNASSLLLIQAIGPGPYLKALEKRGTGIHHICLSTNSFEAEVEKLVLSSLFIHPKSLKTMEQGTIWLCRPGLPFLVELVELPTPLEKEHRFIDSLSLDQNENLDKYVSKLASNFFFWTKTNSLNFKIANHSYSLAIDEILK